jgi:hypothetical protein
MKKLTIMALAVCLMTACEKPLNLDEPAMANTEQVAVPTDANGEPLPTKKFTFTLKGDFSNDWKPVTRGYLSADGKDLTDVWVLDYMGDQLIQQLHQTSTDEAFGQPAMNLAYGNHHVYVIASRSQGAALDTDAHTLTFTKVLDTFYKDYEVSVVSTSNGNRAVTLDRVVTKLKLVIEDAIPTGAATLNIAPATWYYGINYITGNPVAAASSQPIVINIPANNIGKSGVDASIFGFSTSDEWQTDVSFNCKKADDTILGTASLSAVPLKANRVSEYTGPLFSAGGAMTLSLNSTWDDAYQGVW